VKHTVSIKKVIINVITINMLDWLNSQLIVSYWVFKKKVTLYEP